MEEKDVELILEIVILEIVIVALGGFIELFTMIFL